MAALFIDLDGTVISYHTSQWLPEALQELERLAAAGNEIIFVTMRGPQDTGKEWSMEKTYELLKQLSFPHHIIFGLSQPRILIDDGTPAAIQAVTNFPISWIERL